MAIAVLYDPSGSAIAVPSNPLIVQAAAPAGGFSQSTARTDTAGTIGTAVSGTASYNGSLFYHNSAVLAGTSGGHSALIDVVHRPNANMPWQTYGVVITATHSLSGRIGLTAVAGQWATRMLSAFSANGSAPAVTTYFDFGW